MQNKNIPEDIRKILNADIIKVSNDDDTGLGKDLQEIAKQMTSDINAFRFGNMSNENCGNDALLGAIADIPFCPDNVNKRYWFASRFRYHYSINRASIKSGYIQLFVDLASSLMGFRGALEWRSAGLSPVMGEEKNHSILDKIKKR